MYAPLLCSDIRGFSRLTADMDAILAVFGSPEPDPRQHENAVRAALRMQTAVSEITAARAAKGQTTCEMGLGVHSGEVLHGFIGAADRLEFTVIGDAVNRTSRYCDGAGAGEVLISPETHQRVWNVVRARQTTIAAKMTAAQ